MNGYTFLLLSILRLFLLIAALVLLAKAKLLPLYLYLTIAEFIGPALKVVTGSSITALRRSCSSCQRPTGYPVTASTGKRRTPRLARCWQRRSRSTAPAGITAG